MSDYSYPPVNFHFLVSFIGLGDNGNSIDGRFQSVSGLKMEFETEPIKEGGENRFTHKLPTRTKYPNLVLKRGLVASTSKFSKWSIDTLGSNLSKPMVPKNIVVTLLNEKGVPRMAWVIHNAWPIKISYSDLKAMENQLAIETLEFSYQFCDFKPLDK